MDGKSKSKNIQTLEWKILSGVINTTYEISPISVELIFMRYTKSHQIWHEVESFLSWIRNMSVPITSHEKIDRFNKLQPMGLEIDDGADYVMHEVHRVIFVI